MRWLLTAVGAVFTVLAVLGALLPVLPTTPFLLVAGACFARSSPHFHNKLKRMPIFGVYLEQWERDHSIPASAKRKAYTLIVIAFSFSIWAVDNAGGRIALAAVGVILLVLLTKLPTSEETT
ncbi:MAG: YbaN family protein [Planctomycetes bacterium]|nr:YbaN family protein [Planctomycetota bacterium]